MSWKIAPWVVVFALLTAVLGCAEGPRDEEVEMNAIAAEYIQLTLAIGRHDENYVDAYYGPDEWKTAAEAGEPRPMAELRDEVEAVAGRLAALEGSPRKEFLARQLAAAGTFLSRELGEPLTLSEEARGLFDIETPVRDPAEFVAARARLEQLLPGPGSLGNRIQDFRKRFVVPPDRLGDVVRAILVATRESTTAMIELPAGEKLSLSFVNDQPWSAYNWYQGGLTSKIEVNTDLPVEIASVLHTMSHEGYPGHHTYNALLEDRLVRGRRWPEYQVYPLYSPQSLIAEGTANAGPGVILDDEARWTLIEETLAPIAGLEGADFATYRSVLEALEPLRHVRPQAARLLLDEGRPENEVRAFLTEHALMSEERAQKAIDFIRRYRAYVFTYTVGEDLVEASIGDGDDRAERFFALLQEPVTPSALVR